VFDTGTGATLILMVLESPSAYTQQNMDETLRQLGGLLLGSIPTVICFLLLCGLYSLLVHQPLTRVLGERNKRTLGAIEKARADIASAEARTAEYQQRLREARVSLFKAQEARRARAAQARAAAVADAHKRAEAHLELARAGIENEKTAAKQSLEAEAGRMASAIVRIVLEPALAQAPVGGR
jgi:F-type H+-transporting ATPase subunit b